MHIRQYASMHIETRTCRMEHLHVKGTSLKRPELLMLLYLHQAWKWGTTCAAGMSSKWNGRSSRQRQRKKKRWDTLLLATGAPSLNVGMLSGAQVRIGQKPKGSFTADIGCWSIVGWAEICGV